MRTKGTNEWFECLDGSIGIIVRSKRHGVFITCIDREDWPKVRDYRWTVAVVKRSRNVYFQASRRRLDGTLEYARLHTLIMGSPEGMVVDHREPNDSLNNQQSNLRVCTQEQNLANQRKTTVRRTSSQYKGVFRRKRDRLWTAQIGLDSRNKQIGTYETELEAAMAYDEAALHHYGEYALLNFTQPIVVSEIAA